jgi:hypothetical protein
MTKELLEQCYDNARCGIANNVHNLLAEIEDFDNDMSGSSITDELTYEVEKFERKLIRVLNREFSKLGFGKGIVKNYKRFD